MFDNIRVIHPNPLFWFYFKYICNVTSYFVSLCYNSLRKINTAVQKISMFLFGLITTIVRCNCLYEVRFFFSTGQQLHNIDVKVGKTKDSMRMCGHYSASARPGEQIPIWCPSGTVGRYVQVQIVRGEASYLSVAEVIVWGKRK